MDYRKKETTVVVSQKEISAGIFDLRVRTQAAAYCVPGQFAGIFPPSDSRMLMRPISICEANAESGEIRFVYRVAGEGTKMISALKEGDTLCLAGSIPSSMPGTIYSDICKKLDGRGIRIVVDATRDLLVNVLEYHPFLIKPNNHELGEIFGAELKTRESVVPYAKKLQEMGAQNVLISMAGEGGVLAAADGGIYMSEAPKGKLVNGVGAGDSMVAGFLYGFLEKGEYEYAFKMGLSTGSASAFSEYLATKEEVEAVYRSLGH